MTDQLGPICRNCGNTGVDMFGKPCRCPMGKALVNLGDWAERYRQMQGFSVTVSGPPTEYGRVVFEQLHETMQTHGWDEDDSMSGFFVLANHELRRARKKHTVPLNSHHEAYAVVLEELDEAWQEVKSQQADPQRIIAELIQIAAMCARWAEDVCGGGES